MMRTEKIENLLNQWKKQFSLPSREEALNRISPMTRSGKKGLLFFPSHEDHTDFGSERFFSIHKELNKILPTMAVIEDPAQLDAAHSAGNRILISPDFPEIILTAIRSAAWIIAFDDALREIATHYGIPYFTEDLLPKGENEADTASAWARTVSEKTNHEYNAKTLPGKFEYGICTVVDQKYVGFFFGLMENLIRVTKGPWKTYVLALDLETKLLIEKQYPNMAISITLANEIFTGDEWADFERRPVAERAYACKPQTMLAALKEAPDFPVYLCDVDIYFYDSPCSLNHHLQANQILLMPQWSDVFAWSRFYGMYNSGLMGATSEATNFFRWWSEMCFSFSSVNPTRGYFTDQGMLEMGTWLFGTMGVYRELDHNVAPWNRKTLGVNRPNEFSGTLVLKDGRRVKSYHAAGSDSDGFFQLKFCWDQLASFFSILPSADDLEPLFQNTLDQQLVNWPNLRSRIAARKDWARRLHLKKQVFGFAEVRKLLRSNRSATDSILGLLNWLLATYRKILGKEEYFDPASTQEQTSLVAIQQKYTFGPMKPSFLKEAVSS